MMSPAAPTPAAAGLDTAQRSDLDRLDDALQGVRRLLQRPSYRRRLRAALPFDAELTTLRVLRTVERADADAASIGDVAESLGVDPSSASRFVDQAVSGGYLERRTCERDRRRSKLEMTPTGRELLAAASEARRALLVEVTEDWSPEDVAALGDLLERLRAGFDRLGAP